MKKQETSFDFLAHFLPRGSYEQVAPFFRTHVIHLTITHERKSVLGDYRNPTREVPQHRISINANLNPYSFLVTLLHELAHMFTYVQHQHRAAPHGKEWKAEFRKILVPFLGKRYFPPDVEKALLDYLHNPAASTCTDSKLFKALYRYDERKPGYLLVDDLAINQFFELEDGQVFQKLEKVRTRTRCRQVGNNKIYLVQGIMEVKATEYRNSAPN